MKEKPGSDKSEKNQPNRRDVLRAAKDIAGSIVAQNYVPSGFVEKALLGNDALSRTAPVDPFMEKDDTPDYRAITKHINSMCHTMRECAVGHLSCMGAKKRTQKKLAAHIAQAFQWDFVGHEQVLTHRDQFQAFYAGVEHIRHAELKEELLKKIEVATQYLQAHAMELPENYAAISAALKQDDHQRLQPAQLQALADSFADNTPESKELYSNIERAVARATKKYQEEYAKIDIQPFDAREMFGRLAIREDGSVTYHIDMNNIFKYLGDYKFPVFDITSPTLVQDFQRALVQYARDTTGYALHTFDSLFENEKQKSAKMHEEKRQNTPGNVARNIEMRSAFSRDDYRRP